MQYIGWIASRCRMSWNPEHNRLLERAVLVVAIPHPNHRMTHNCKQLFSLKKNQINGETYSFRGDPSSIQPFHPPEQADSTEYWPANGSVREKKTWGCKRQIKRSIGAGVQKSDNARRDPPSLPDIIWALNYPASPLGSGSVQVQWPPKITWTE